MRGHIALRQQRSTPRGHPFAPHLALALLLVGFVLANRGRRRCDQPVENAPQEAWQPAQAGTRTSRKRGHTRTCTRARVRQRVRSWALHLSLRAPRWRPRKRRRPPALPRRLMPCWTVPPCDADARGHERHMLRESGQPVGQTKGQCSEMARLRKPPAGAARTLRDGPRQSPAPLGRMRAPKDHLVSCSGSTFLTPASSCSRPVLARRGCPVTHPHEL